MIVDKEWINNFPKWVNENGCWIPERKARPDGYICIGIRRKYYFLHRLSMCAFYNIEYHNSEVVTRHKRGCSRKCFNPDHLLSGSASDNTLDNVENGTHINSRKEYCPKCGGAYHSITVKSGSYKGQAARRCRVCRLKVARSSNSMSAFLKRLKKESLKAIKLSEVTV